MPSHLKRRAKNADTILRQGGFLHSQPGRAEVSRSQVESIFHAGADVERCET